MIKFDKLMTLIKQSGKTKTVITKKLGIGTNTMSALTNNRVVTTETINRVCEYFHCQPGDIMEYVPDSPKITKEAILRQIAVLQKELEIMEELENM